MLNEAITEVVDFITGLGLDADVTDNATAAANSLSQGRAVIVVPPPRITALTTVTAEFEFKTIVAAGPFDNQGRAVQTLEPLLLALMRSDLMPSDAEPNVFQSADNYPYPCYVLTHTTYSD